MSDVIKQFTWCSNQDRFPLVAKQRVTTLEWFKRAEIYLFFMLHVLSRLAMEKRPIEVSQKTTLIKALSSEGKISGLVMVGSKNAYN